LAGLLVVLSALSCASSNCRRAVEGTVSLEIWHSLGGFAPISSSIQIYDDGQIVYEPPRGRKVYVLLKDDEYLDLRGIVEAEQFKEVIRQADADATHYGEVEEIFIASPGFAARVPLEVAPQQMSELLEVLAALLRHTGSKATWDRSRGD
jgi:hypothetical protein